MELPKNMVDIKLQSKKNKRKLNDRDESKTNTKLHMKNITINVKNKEKDNIPITFTLTKQNCNETKTVKNKNKEKYSEGTSKSWLDITYDYNHVDSNNSKTSLICPALGYTCSLFSNLFDHHDEDIKNILINANNDNLPSD